MAEHDKPVAAWLLGDPSDAAEKGPNGNGFVVGSPGLLSRLTEYYPGEPTGPSQTLTLVAAALGLVVPPSGNSCTLTVEGAPVRARFDGIAATATVGLLLPAGAVMQLGGKATMFGASFFTASAGGIVQVQYWT